MSKSTAYLSASILLSTFVMIGCGSDATADQTSSNDGQSADPLPMFDGQSMRTSVSPWNIPESRINLHTEDLSTQNTLGVDVAVNASALGIRDGGLATTAIATETEGSAITGRRPGGDTPFVSFTTTNFLGQSGSLRSIAKGIDGVLYGKETSWDLDWSLFFPSRTDVGLSWQSDMDMTANNVGKIFVYQPLGDVYYRPTVRTVESPLGTNQDSELDAERQPVDVFGNPTSDEEQIAIDYATAPGYRGAWMDVKRLGHLRIIATGVTSPEVGEPGCIKIRLDHRFVPMGERPRSLTMTLGLEQFQGGYDLYWKPGIGWIEWSGSESAPVFGLDNLPSTIQVSGTFSLSSYNASYAISKLGAYDGATGPSNTLPYMTHFQEGYSRGYRDASLPSPGYYNPERLSFADSIAVYRTSSRASDTDLLSGSGTSRGAREVIDVAFKAGYELGVQRYAEDYVENPLGYDYLDTGRNDRRTILYSFNKVPSTFRPVSVFLFGADKASTILADYPSVGMDNPNGYNGLGKIVDSWDESITQGTGAVRRKLDDRGVEMRGVYVGLPVIGNVRIRTVSGRITSSGMVANNG